MNKQYFKIEHQHQKGAILVLALILLLVMSLVGVSANRDVILQERMAGNELDNNIALQAAEAVLREAEAVFGDCAPSELLFNGSTNGYYDFEITTARAPGWEAAAELADGSSSWIASDLDEVSQDPRYMAERLEPVPLSNDLVLGQPDQSAIPFKITAQGFGTSTKTDAVVQVVRYTYNCG